MPKIENLYIGTEQIYNEQECKEVSFQVIFESREFEFLKSRHLITKKEDHKNTLEILFKNSSWFKWLYREDPQAISFKSEIDLLRNQLLIKVTGICHDTKQITYLLLRDQ